MSENKNFNVVVNGVIVDKKGRMLIARRASDDDHEAGMWTTPGGTLEVDGEEHGVIEETLSREIMEEVGVAISKNVVFITNNTFIKSNGAHVLAIVFLCFHEKGIAKPLDETDEVRWVDSISELNNLSFPPNVKEYFEKAISKLNEIRK